MASKLADAYLSIRAPTDALKSDLASARSMVASSVSGMAGVAGGILAASGIKSLLGQIKELGVGIGKAMISTNASLEVAQTSLATMLKSESVASRLISDIRTMAAKTPFEFAGLTQASQQLIGVGVAANQVLPMLGKLGDAASASTEGMQALPRIVRAVTQMLSKGKIQAQEMSLQISELGIPAWDILAKKIGVSTGELMKMSQAGALGKKEIMLLIEGMGERFQGMMQKQSRTFTGMMNTLRDSVNIGLQTIGKPIFDRVKGVMTEIINFIDRNGEDFATWGVLAADAIGAVMEKLAGLGRAIKDSVGMGNQDAKQMFTEILAGLSVAVTKWQLSWSILKAFTLVKMSEIRDGFRRMLDTIWSWTKARLEANLYGWTVFAKKLGSIWDAIGEGIKAAIGAGLSGAGGEANAFVAAFNKHMAAMKTPSINDQVEQRFNENFKVNPKLEGDSETTKFLRDELAGLQKEFGSEVQKKIVQAQSSAKESLANQPELPGGGIDDNAPAGKENAPAGKEKDRREQHAEFSGLIEFWKRSQSALFGANKPEIDLARSTLDVEKRQLTVLMDMAKRWIGGGVKDARGIAAAVAAAVGGGGAGGGAGAGKGGLPKAGVGGGAGVPPLANPPGKFGPQGGFGGGAGGVGGAAAPPAGQPAPPANLKEALDRRKKAYQEEMERRRALLPQKPIPKGALQRLVEKDIQAKANLEKEKQRWERRKAGIIKGNEIKEAIRRRNGQPDPSFDPFEVLDEAPIGSIQIPSNKEKAIQDKIKEMNRLAERSKENSIQEKLKEMNRLAQQFEFEQAQRFKPFNDAIPKPGESRPRTKEEEIDRQAAGEFAGMSEEKARYIRELRRRLKDAADARREEIDAAEIMRQRFERFGGDGAGLMDVIGGIDSAGRGGRDGLDPLVDVTKSAAKEQAERDRELLSAVKSIKPGPARAAA